MSSERNESYFRVSSRKISYSHQLADDVIADYDEGGQVVGLEFLDPDAAAKREEYLALANRKSAGRQKVGTPPSSDKKSA